MIRIDLERTLQAALRRRQSHSLRKRTVPRATCAPARRCPSPARARQTLSLLNAFPGAAPRETLLAGTVRAPSRRAPVHRSDRSRSRNKGVTAVGSSKYEPDNR